MEYFKKDSAFNFAQVLKLAKYLKGHKGYIAGGCFKNIFREENVKDVDLFFESEEDFNEAVEIYKEDETYTGLYENDNAVGYFDTVNEIAVDLVKSQFETPVEMIDSFDFTITKFALHFEEIELTEEEIAELGETPKPELRVVYHEDFFEHLTLKRLVIDKDIVDFPLNTFDRMLRYCNYGYAPCIGTKTKLVRIINTIELPEDDTVLFKGFYVGID